MGLRALLNGIVEFAPDPAHHEAEYGRPVDGRKDAERLARRYSDSEPFSAYCFRTVADPFAGRINVMKVISGHLQSDANVLNSSHGTMERLGALHAIQGKQLDKITEAHAGDIIACVKLKETRTGDTLCDKQAPIVYDPVEYPEAAIAFAIEPKSRQDEEKISVALHKILEEDPALHFSRDSQTKEFLLIRFRTTARGNGRREAEEALQRRSNVAPAERYLTRKRSRSVLKCRAGTKSRRGDADSLATARLSLSHCRGAVVLFSKTKSSVAPYRNSFVQRSRKESWKRLCQAPSPVIHSWTSGTVDRWLLPRCRLRRTFVSRGRAEGIPGSDGESEAFDPRTNHGRRDCGAQENSGDIMGDLNSRRGRVQGMEASGKQQVIKAQVPMSEMLNYQSTLNSITGARGSFHMQFSHYDPVPGNLSHKIVEQSSAEGRIRGGEEED